MQKQYDILNLCLAELKRSGLPAVKKLKLEVQLIQIKRLLLQQQFKGDIAGASSSEEGFSELHKEVRRVCSLSVEGSEVDKVILSLIKLNENLKGLPGSNLCDTSSNPELEEIRRRENKTGIPRKSAPGSLKNRIYLALFKKIFRW